eukprot:GHVR01114018.1.p1 GENE.GHVR01114018.1~~GHVR01114018.1.p1  ORF type:complete len:154 (+),score=0.62 GHVR01114018.1:918-1379(+)
MNDPFMTADPIPKTIPRSTLACPPAKNFTEQVTKNSTNQLKVQPKEPERDKIISKNDSEKGFKNLYNSSGTNFRSSSKDFKQSTKNLPKNTESIQNLQKDKNIIHSEIHVKKWVDYSTKYGLGYLLSDGSTGVFFNDSTKIIMDKNGDNFEYI